MTKEQILKELDLLIDDEKEAIEGYNKAIQKLSDSPAIATTLGRLYSDEVEHLRSLDDLKFRVENHENFMEKVKLGNMFGVPCDCVYEDNDGIVFTEAKKGE